MRIESEITVERPRTEVFGYLLKAELLPQYVTDFESVEQVSDGEPRQGTEYSYRMARGAQGTFAWTKVVPSSHLAWSGPAVKAGLGSMQPAGWWDLSDSSGGSTGVKLVMAPQPGGLLKLLAPFMAAAMRKGNDEALERLKQRLEQA